MDLGLKGRVALVAASSSGLGLAVAKSLAKEGADVSICGRDPDRLAGAHVEVNTMGPGAVLSTPLDLRSERRASEWVQKTADELGGLDVVVTNCGGVPVRPRRQLRALRSTARRSRTNMLTHVKVALEALPLLKESGWGRILMIASEAVRQPDPESGLSSVARLGLLGFMKGLVDSLGPSGVTVNVLAPGFHRTPILDKQFGENVDEELAKVAEKIPLGRLGDLEEFGALASFAASQQAAYVTGTVLVADGGNSHGIG